MEIATKKENGTLTVTLTGRLDTISSPELEKTLTENIEGAAELVFDLAKLAYTSSAGLRVFLKSKKMMAEQGGVRLINVSEAIMEIFEMTGFIDILTIEAAK